MIFFQILMFIVSIVLLSLSISGYGRLTKLNINRNFFLDVFIGLTIISLIIIFIHFFFKINLLISFVIFSFGILMFFYKKNHYLFKLSKLENTYCIIILFLLLPIFFSQKYHEDFGYYHLQYALGFIEDKIIFGFANIDAPYVYNSIWLNLYSIFFLSDKNFNFLTLPSFLIFLNFILFSTIQLISKNEKKTSDYLLLITLFYFILKFTRISEFGVDLPAVIFSILTIYYFLRFSETNSENEKKEYFFLVSIFSSFSILIKLSTIPILLLPVFLYLKYFQDLKLSVFKPKFFLIYMLLITFFIQQFIFTGCLFFPNNFTCLNVSWLNKENIDLPNELELVNKSYFSVAKDYFTPEEYLKNFNWFSFWLKRNSIEIIEHLLTMILPIVIFTLFQKKKNHHKFILENKLILYLFLVLGFIFWLNYSPVYRFGIHLFLTLIFILFINNLLSKNFSKNFFLVFLMILIFFNFSKNIVRINNVEKIFLGTQKIDNQYILNEKNTNTLVKIYMPDIEKNSNNGWQGRLCWNIPFICSYNKLEVEKKNGYLIIKKVK